MNERIENAIKEIEQENKRLKKMIYPYIGISSGMLNQIILFTAPATGININNKGWPMGKSSEGWDEKSFIPYYGKIIIINGRIEEFTDSERSKDLWNDV